MTAPVENVEPIPENTPQQPIVATETPSQEQSQEQNWKKFREVREQDRKAREEANAKYAQKEAEAQALKAAMEAILNKNQPNQQQHDEYEDESEDKRIEKKVLAALEQHKRVDEEQRRLREHQEMPVKLKQIHADFDRVCTEDNLDYLEYHYPEVARAFGHMPDSIEKWDGLYKAVKRFIPNNTNKEQKLAQKNVQKPQSMAVGGATQTGDSAPINLDEKRRADNWARMQKVMKGGR